MDEIPQWAFARAQQLGSEWGLPGGCNLTGLARYISEREQPPVDPLLIEARSLVASRNGGCVSYLRAVMDGQDDDSDAVKNCVIALRRGIEIGKAS